MCVHAHVFVYIYTLFKYKSKISQTMNLIKQKCWDKRTMLKHDI